MAALTGSVLSDNLDDFIDDQSNEVSFDSLLSPEEIVCAKFKECGFVYFKETDTNWFIFVARMFDSSAWISEPTESGVFIIWKADGPSCEEILQFTGLDVRNLHEMTQSEGQVFFPCPLGRRLGLDVSKVKSHIIPVNHPRWLVTIFPFQSDDSASHTVSAILPFIFPNEFTEAPINYQLKYLSGSQ